MGARVVAAPFGVVAAVVVVGLRRTPRPRMEAASVGCGLFEDNSCAVFLFSGLIVIVLGSDYLVLDATTYQSLQDQTLGRGG